MQHTIYKGVRCFSSCNILQQSATKLPSCNNMEDSATEYRVCCKDASFYYIVNQ